MVSPGNMVLVPANEFFSYEAVKPCTHHWIHFLSESLSRKFKIKYPVIVPVAQAEYLSSFEYIENVAQSNNNDIKILVGMHNRLLEILIPFLENIQKSNPQNLAPGKFSAVLDAIENMLPGEVDLSRLTRLAGLNRAVFSAQFRAAFGMPPKEYIVNRRISMAKIMLLRTNLTNKEIAEKVGYDNEYFFYRIFRKYAHMTPSQYRTGGIFD